MTIEAITKIGSLGVDPALAVMPEMQTTNVDGNFTSLLMDKFSSIDASLHSADSLVERYIKGEDVAVHDVLISMGKAKTELQLAVEIRNKLLESYQEITKIQL